MYDIIGDIHGHAKELKQLLLKMSYKEVDGVWQHPTRTVIFVGDYIDRGPAIRETLSIVRTMVEKDKAIALMGNHEYNALAYAYKLPDGTYLREHKKVHDRQHEQTLKQFKDHPAEWQSYLQWFYTLPLFLELPELNAVHACWDAAHIKWLKEHNNTTLTEELLVTSHQRGTDAYEVINDTLKGKEFTVPEEYAWEDKDGHTRFNNRLRWWIDYSNATYGDFLFNCPPHLKNQKFDKAIKAVIYPKEAPPVFFGHYWMEDNYPVIQAVNVVCLDYSIAKDGNLVAYRFGGEKELVNSHFIHVPCQTGWE